MSFLENLLTPIRDYGSGQAVQAQSFLSDLAPGLKINQAAINHALARIEMARFFRAHQRKAYDEAARYLHQGLKYDKRWLLNRGVLSFIFKRVLGNS
jgi:hypothetical protein